MENNISFYSVPKNSSTCAKSAAKAYLSLSNKSRTLANRRGGTPVIQSGCFPLLPDNVRVGCVPHFTKQESDSSGIYSCPGIGGPYGEKEKP